MKKQTSSQNDLLIVDEKTYERLKRSLEEAKKSLLDIREAKKAFRQSESMTLDNPPTEYLHLVYQETATVEKIAEMSRKLGNCQIKEHDTIRTTTIGINDSVTLKMKYSDEDEEKTTTYKLVSCNTDPFVNEISKNSPIGASILGRKVNETVNIQLKNGISIEIRILSKE